MGDGADTDRVVAIKDYRQAKSERCDVDGEACRRAVTRTYHELREHGIHDPMAFQASLRVYCLRHPEVPPADARDRVAAWISDELGQ